MEGVSYIFQSIINNILKYKFGTYYLYLIPASIGVIIDFLIFYFFFEYSENIYFSNFVAFFFSNLINIYISKKFIFRNSKNLYFTVYIYIYFFTFIIVISSTIIIDIMRQFNYEVYTLKSIMYFYSYTLNYIIRKFFFK